MHAITTFLLLGCWLGDSMSNLQEGKKVWIPGGIKDHVRIAECLSSTLSKLAINLLNALFTSEQMTSGNCTPSTKHDLLDQKRIEGIRCKLLPSYANACITPPLISNAAHVKYLYPCEPSEES